MILQYRAKYDQTTIKKPIFATILPALLKVTSAFGAIAHLM